MLGKLFGLNLMRPCDLGTPFRRYNELTGWTSQERERLRSDALAAKPYESVGFSDYNLLIVGPCKAGKSSLKSTMKSAFLGEVSYQGDVGTATTSLTKKYTIGPMRDNRGQVLGHFRFAVLTGVDFVNIDDTTIGGILDGKMKYNYEFIDGVTPELTVEPEVAKKNKIHCVVMVLDGTKTDMMQSDGHIFRVLRDFRRQARQRDIPVAVVLTHLDQICQCVANDLSKVLTCKSVKEAMMSVVQPLGIDPNRVFVVQNYARLGDVHVDIKINCLALLTLKYLLQYCREYADSCLDAQAHDG